MKNIIKRNLSLDVKYTVVDKQYIPLEHGCGMGCDNCGALIANIATVVDENGKRFSIGFDCMETLLINNGLLSTGDIAEYERVKSMIPKIIRFSKSIRKTIFDNKERGLIITGLKFEKPMRNSDYYPFWWLTGNQTTSRNNDYVKLKDIDFSFLLTTLKAIFPNITIINE